jgi:hypothetical protein
MSTSGSIFVPALARMPQVEARARFQSQQQRGSIFEYAFCFLPNRQFLLFWFCNFGCFQAELGRIGNCSRLSQERPCKTAARRQNTALGCLLQRGNLSDL